LNNKRILFLFQFDSNKHLLKRLGDELRVFEIATDSFNVRTFSYSGNQTLKLKIFKFLVRIPKLRVIIYHLFRKKIILDLCQKYDLVDIHFFSSIYDDILLDIKKPVKIVFWGSDLYRITKERLNKLNVLVSNAKSVQFLTPEMKTFVSKSLFKHNNVFIQPFGVVHFEKIRSLKTDFTIAEIKTKLGLNAKKIQVTVGYNASPSQQHLEIIKEITIVPENFKSRIELVFLMTYGGNSTYQHQVEIELKKLGCDFKIISNHLNEEQICSYRIASDITLNFQTSDGFSSSIQEHFFAGNIMLLADWLPYQWLREKGLHFHSTSFHELNEKLEFLIQNLEIEKIRSLKNTHQIEIISDWKYATKNWLEIYKQTLES
jgi:glycosyltransferase involved in cell wall biosynthesis